MTRHGWRAWTFLWTLVFVVLAGAGSVLAAGEPETLTVSVGESRVIAVQNLERVAVAEPAIADVLVASAREVIVNGKKAGTTSLHLWEGGVRRSLLVKVESDSSALVAQLTEAIGDPAVQVRVIQGTVFLDGQVDRPETAARADKIARALSGRVVNLLRVSEVSVQPFAPPVREAGEREKESQEQADQEKAQAEQARLEARRELPEKVASAIGLPSVKASLVGETLLVDGTVPTDKDAERAKTIAEALAAGLVNKVSVTLRVEPVEPPQVLLQVQVTEVSATTLSQLGIVWGGYTAGSDGSTTFDQGVTWIGELAINGAIGRLSPLVGHVDALLKDGSAKLLAAPSILTRSGKQADFLAGGEIPVPVLEKDGYTVYWKEYGIKLSMQPEVRPDGDIMVHLKPEVSTLDWSNGAKITGGTIPALRTRRAETDVRLRDGETLVIGGLLSSEDSKNATGLPGLSKLPIIGPLFASKGFQTGRTQLVLFVTPHLVKDGGPRVVEVTSPSAPEAIPSPGSR